MIWVWHYSLIVTNRWHCYNLKLSLLLVLSRAGTAIFWGYTTVNLALTLPYDVGTAIIIILYWQYYNLELALPESGDGIARF